MKELIQDEVFARQRQYYYKQVLSVAGTLGLTTEYCNLNITRMDI